ncbi:MAG: 1-deoxy-D-xylulose-5-phosphate reductoisomerase [Spirochaetaceae bacterium]|jgi:1-deoxy-D-xylulose-5-phosphate reductoisomerase|nr:1-deoxy-D-xylulose-5-phosphate reductoisomerase [Spirochaetaceae bacterium]
MIKKKRVAVLGATGSIGKSTMDVLRSGKDDFEPVLFSCHRKTAALLALAKEYPGAALAVSGLDPGGPGCGEFSRSKTYFGREGLLRSIAECGAGIVVNGIAGAAGLEPSLAVLETGADLALANKETMVMAGELVFSMARRSKARIIPVDSEHSAVFSLLEAHGKDRVAEILLTASGGPFRKKPREELGHITLKEALNHPTWNMGPKITIDSATLANKGLEAIEAAELFNMDIGRIKVVVHPQSIVHSMVRLKDGAVYAQLSRPDIRLPIHNALYYPDITPCSFGFLDFDSLCLEFEKPDYDRFPMLPLAYETSARGGMYPAIYNAANEVAVSAFTENRAGFSDIPRIATSVLNGAWDFAPPFPGAGSAETLRAILETDRIARERAENYILETIRC